MYERLKELCVEKGISITALCMQVTGSSGNLPTWKKGYMRSDYLLECAKILGVSTDYILGFESLKHIPLRTYHEQTVFYSYVRLKLQDRGKDWESVVSDFGYCDKLRVLYEHGLFPSDEFTRYLADEIGLHPQNLIDRIDKDKQLSHDLETIITKCDSLSPVRKNAVTAFLNAIDTIG